MKYTSKHPRQHVVERRGIEAAKPMAKITYTCKGCTIRIIRGEHYIAIQPDCEIHSPLYGGIILRGPELVGGRSITTFRKAVSE